MVGYLDMTDPTQQCPDSWQKIASPRSSCGKKSTALCDSLNITTSGASYTTVCGRFRGYQGGSPDAFNSLTMNMETHYVDGVTVTYGSPGNRHHVYTYAAGVYELNTSQSSCPCTGAGIGAPVFVGSDFYCESGCPGLSCTFSPQLYSPDVLWDRQQCGGNEGTCCDPPNLPWFCKMFPNPISEDLEVRICTDEGFNNENVAIESFELYIQGNIQTVSVFNPDISLHQLEISWIPVGDNVTTYTVRVVGADGSVGQGPNNFVYKNISLSDSKLVACSFLSNQSFYCMVCCSTDPSVPPDSSVYNISTTRGTEVTVFLQGLTSGQMYYCKAAATNTNSTRCAGPVVGNSKMYFSIATRLPSITPPTTPDMASIDTYTTIGITIVISFVVFFSLGVSLATCIGCMMKTRSKVKVTLPHPALEPSTYEMIETDQKKTTSIKIEANSAYGTAISLHKHMK
eukprot:Em0002g64a